MTDHDNRRAQIDIEISALTTITILLEKLDRDAQQRVCTYLAMRYGH